jgi:hypothetical protein
MDNFFDNKRRNLEFDIHFFLSQRLEFSIEDLVILFLGHNWKTQVSSLVTVFSARSGSSNFLAERCEKMFFCSPLKYVGTTLIHTLHVHFLRCLPQMISQQVTMSVIFSTCG